MPSLKEILESQIEPMREEIRALISEYGDTHISDVTVAQAYGGMRGVKGLVTETSSLDPVDGIRFRGHTIPEVREKLPKAKGGSEPLPEGIFFLLLTGEIPTEEDVEAITTAWRSRARLPEHVRNTLDSLPPGAHPMTQFSIGIMALQTESVFARQYAEGIPKKRMWDPVYEDAMNLIASLPLVAAYIYRRSFHNGDHIAPAPPEMDWAGSFAHMLGFEDPEFAELMRLYMVLHCDHEGGNVSAHTIHLVGSALSDPYQSLAAGMNGLAGPLHGLANQEVLRWITTMREKLGGGVPKRKAIEEYCWETLNEGRVIPGYGHAVLRQTDPRYTAQREFALEHMPDDELFQIVAMLYDIVPPILEKHGRAKNPWPNVDAHSGALLVHYGLDQPTFYTVMFGVSRALGTMASLIWDRALGLPLERPKSVTTQWVKQFVQQTSTED